MYPCSSSSRIDSAERAHLLDVRSRSAAPDRAISPVDAHEANDAWQGEVGLLSRTIVVQGAAADSEPTDTSPLSCRSDAFVFGRYEQMPCPNSYQTGFGGHVRAEGASAPTKRVCVIKTEDEDTS